MDSDPAGAKAVEPASQGAGARGGGWLLALLIAFLLLVGGFAAFVIKQGSAGSAAQDMSAFQRLAITSQRFAAWPDTADRIGAQDLPWKTGGGSNALHFERVIQTPELGRVPIAFPRCRVHAPGDTHPFFRGPGWHGADGQRTHGDVRPGLP